MPLTKMEKFIARRGIYAGPKLGIAETLRLPDGTTRTFHHL